MFIFTSALVSPLLVDWGVAATASSHAALSWGGEVGCGEVGWGRWGVVRWRGWDEGTTCCPSALLTPSMEDPGVAVRDTPSSWNNLMKTFLEQLNSVE